MNWAHIIELSKAGIQFGSAATSHVHLTSLSPVEMVKELTISRKVLQERLQCPVYLFSYPFNHCDDVVAHLVEACGYRIGIGAYAGVASYADSIFKLPNLDVKGTDTLEKFIVKIKSGHK